MEKMLVLALLVALFGFSFAGTIVGVGETVPVGGTTTTTTTTTTTEETSTEGTEEEGSTGGLGGLTMENSEGDTINVGGTSEGIAPLGSGEGASGASGFTGSSESGSTTFPGGSSGSSSTNSGTSPGNTTCSLAFMLLACAIAAFSMRK